MASESASVNPLNVGSSEMALRTGEDLDARINIITDSLFRNFENLLSLAMDGETDPFSTAQNEYQMEAETAMLVSKAEDVLTLTRGMKELWLQGHLNTLRKPGSEDEKLDEDVQAVAAMLDHLIKERDRSIAEAGAEVGHGLLFTQSTTS